MFKKFQEVNSLLKSMNILRLFKHLSDKYLLMGFSCFTLLPATNECVQFPARKSGPSRHEAALTTPHPTAPLCRAQIFIALMTQPVPQNGAFIICSLNAGRASVYHPPSISTLSPSLSIANLGLHAAVCWVNPFCWVITGTQFCHFGPLIIKP